MLRLAALAALAGLTACQVGAAAAPPRAGGQAGSGGEGGGPPCLDADGDGYPATTCGGNDCDDSDPTVHPGAPEACGGPDRNCDGMVAPCGCTPGKTRACYPPGLDAPTRNLGACHDGVEKCQTDGLTWGDCEGAVLPASEGDVCDGVDQDCNGNPDDGMASVQLNRCGVCGLTTAEICGNGLDDDCNGLIDDPAICNVSCLGVDPANQPCCGGDRPSCQHIDCQGRQNQPCYSGPPQTLGVGVCHGGRNSCVDDGTGTNTLAPTACEGEHLPGIEICGNELDDDCDGLIDEDDGNGRACTHAGTCPDGSAPRAERCGDGIDSDCNGRGGPGEKEDAGCCVPAGEETCNGKDDDCDGLVDEGVVDACGGCGVDPCYLLVVSNPANCSEGSDRICSQVAPDGSDLAFTIAHPVRGPYPAPHRAYLPVIDRNQVAQVDTVTGAKSWQVDSLGDSPGPVVASPFEDGVWFLNQGTLDSAAANLVHLDGDGNLLCLASVPAPATALAVDANRKVWVGRFDPPELRAFAPYATAGIGADGYPTCQPIGDVVAVAESITGLALDDRGILWTASPSRQSIRLDTTDGTMALVKHNASSYSVVIGEDGATWFAGSPGHRIAADGPYLNPAAYERDLSTEVIRVAPGHDGRMWFTSADTLLVADPSTMALKGVTALPVNNGKPTGMAEADDASMWLALAGGRVARYETNGALTLFDVDVGHGLAPSGDFTGAIGHYAHAPRASWKQILDSGWVTTIWRRLEWTADATSPSLVSAQAFFSPTRAGLDSAPPCVLASSPADLSACPGSHFSRFMAFEFRIHEAFDGSDPSVGSIGVAYTRP